MLYTNSIYFVIIILFCSQINKTRVLVATDEFLLYFPCLFSNSIENSLHTSFSGGKKRRTVKTNYTVLVFRMCHENQSFIFIKNVTHTRFLAESSRKKTEQNVTLIFHCCPFTYVGYMHRFYTALILMSHSILFFLC